MTTESAQTIVIIGAGVAAAKAIDGIRESDPVSRVVLIGDEDQVPYDRPPLSKAVLIGTDPEDSAILHPKEWYADHRVELRLGMTASAIDPRSRTVTTSNGEDIAWDRLLLATGSSVRRLTVPGAELMDVLYLRSMTDSAALRARLVAGSDVVIVGGGWIGLEVAAAARAHGCNVTILEPQATPLLAVVGERVGSWFADLHRSQGVDLRLGDGIERLEGEGQVSAVVTTSGETLPADTVVVGIGITPNTALAEAAGLDVDNGIVTDSALRTSVDGIWAVGDVARWASTTFDAHVRVEHWANAHDGGLAAGRSIAGQEVTYDPIPFFYSDQYDIGLEYAGYVARGAASELVLRGDPSGNEFMAFWLTPEADGGRLLAGMHVNVWDTIDDVQALIRGGGRIDRGRLADPAVPLGDVGV